MKMLPTFDLLLACTPKRGIGFQNKLPWKLNSDLKTFKKITSNNILIMGRKTFESIGSKPLPNRINIVLTSKQMREQGIEKASSLSEALNLSKELNPNAKIYVIGGSKVFEEALSQPTCRYIYETQLADEFPCDVFAPKHDFPLSYVSKTFCEANIRFDYRQYYNPIFQKPTENAFTAPVHEELQYTQKVIDIINNGENKLDRTAVGTKSLFGGIMRYDLSQSFPLLTHKKVFWRGVVEELLFFLRGSTNAKELEDKGINIWKEHSSKKYLSQMNQNREEGDLGPVYGYQWRHWNAPYTNCNVPYDGKGIDQLQNVIEELKRNPNSRRLIVSSWNPSQIEEMALPPCHLLFQFNVSASGALNCLMFQRSADMGLGVPFNIASYSLLTCIIAQITGLKRGEFIHTMGDMHVYQDHISQLKNIDKIAPFAFPNLEVHSSVKEIADLSSEKIILKGYKSHGKIEMKMAV